MKLAVVTGGRTGIGKAAIEKFQSEDFTCINISRQPLDLKDVININIDLSRDGWSAQTEAALLPYLQQAKIISLVHNAGRHSSDTVDAIKESDLTVSLKVNVIAPALLNKIVIPFQKPGSSILYIGSTLSEKAVPGCASYVTAKHAVIGLMRSTCQDLAGKQIHTACVCPGFTDTDMLREHVGQSQEILDSIASISTYNRLITPPEIAETIYFCAANAVVNGTILHANLGQIER